jgi:hypothetical protein
MAGNVWVFLVVALTTVALLVLIATFLASILCGAVLATVFPRSTADMSRGALGRIRAQVRRQPGEA